MALVAHCVLRSLGAYRSKNLDKAYASAAQAATAWLMASCSLLLFMHVAGAANGQIIDWLTGWFVTATMLLLCLRLGLAHTALALKRAGRLGNTVCIVGIGDEARSCAEYLGRGDGDTVLLGHFSTHLDREQSLRDLSYLGDLARLPTFLLRNRVDELILAPSDYERSTMEAVIAFLCCLPVNLTIWSESIGCPTRWSGSNCRTENARLLTICKAPFSGWRWFFKDVHDRAVALIALCLSLPLFAIIALAIRLSSPGPVFFRQTREGYCGREFQIFKFRSMHATASRSSDRLELTAKADQRVFPIGRLLRRTSLDELPQLLNVIVGDMWLVGPRPHSPLATAAGRRYSEAVPQYRARHRTKPGITGWAQVNGWRGPTNSDEQIQQRVAHDLDYIANWSPLLDWRIMIMTVVRGFIHENAY